MKLDLAVILMCVGMGSCNPGLPTAPDLYVDFEMIDTPTSPLNPVGKSYLEGVYEVVKGNDELGNPIVGKWVGNRWCLYSQQDVVFSVCAGGSLGDSSIQLWGYTRIVRSGSGNKVQFTVSPNDGAREVISARPPSALRFQGVTDNGEQIELRRIRNINSSRFERMAHRGGARNSERLGISENSIPMVRYAPLMGATGVEVDVQRTRDNQLIIFHDDSFSPRTVQGAYLLGKVGNYDLEQIRALGKLINGEPIPTLAELLTAVIDDTDLKLVWLDIKDAGEVGQVVQVQKEMLTYAATKGRDSLKILMGIPSQEVLDAWIPYSTESDALCELEVSTVLAYPHILVWAPTWTRDITPGYVAEVHSQGKRVFTWTVDVREGMLDYLNRGDIDGILSNYPSLVTALHDSRE
jgi:glycerophosphoryl diester phosphodiesterase